ncbi:MAG: putative glycosyltransferase [Parcubacteria group bacterium GW2011_GWE2_38_18]|nr:MAG: putative glycosyltransferase [Parcubacteria group bacterium GW2011_GWE2_38_18]
MKICIINNLIRPLGSGTERIVEIVTNGLIEKGHKVFIITTKPHDIDLPQINMVKIYGLGGFSSSFYRLREIPLFFRLFWHLINIFNLSNYFKVNRILKKEKPDLVITNNLMGVGFLTHFAIKKNQIKHYHILHDVQLLHPSGLIIYGKEKIIDSGLAKIYQTINRQLFLRPDLIISPSEWLLKLHLSKGLFTDSKNIVLPNPIKNFETTETAVRGDCFLCVGQVEPHKGIVFTIETFNHLEKKLKLSIIGSGSQIETAKEKAKVNPGISFLGQVDHEAIKDFMLTGKALILPSLCYENSPTSIYEAFVCGLPVIGANIGGIPELLNDKCGILFEPGNAEDLKNKIDWFFDHSEEVSEMIEKAKKKIKTFDVNIYLDNILKN